MEILAKRTIAIITAAALVSALPACNKGESTHDADADEADLPDEEPAEDTIEEDTAHDEGPDGCTGPPACSSAPDDHEVIGGPCISELDCGSGNTCYAERIEVWEGEVYTSWRSGTCAIIGAGSAGCDPEDPSTCPDGTKCVYLFNSGGEDYHGCLDACSAAAAPEWTVYPWSCGCRQGYACDINNEACLPGCSNDRECCEVWDDTNDDNVRDADEVHFDSECTNYCDGDDDDEYLDDECKAAWDCINHGDSAATYHSECLFASDCPADGRCLNEVYYRDDETDEPYYPGGLCLKDRCELPGRGCEGPGGADIGGECVNLGSTTDPFYACIASCVVGYGPEDDDLNPCRHPTDGHPYTCSPHPPERWFPASTLGSDGLCFPATVPRETPDPLPLFDATCSADEDCVSPKGLGTCFDPYGTTGFCSAACNESLATTHLVCGAAASAGEVPPGVCGLGICLPSCDEPGSDLGANGCPDASMACYPNGGTYPEATHDPAGTAPAGYCLQACRTSTDCERLWVGATACNTTSGVCG